MTTAEREREKTSNRNAIAMDERASSRTTRDSSERRKKEEYYLVFASAALLDDAHFGRFRCHDDVFYWV